jgi:hypothetical protein
MQAARALGRGPPPFATADRRRTFCDVLPPIVNDDPGDETAED